MSVLYHGMAIGSYQLTWHEYTVEDYARFVDWGCNTVSLGVYWTAKTTPLGMGIESDEMQPGVYNETNLAIMERQINLALDHGLHPWIKITNQVDPDNPSENRVGWSDKYGSDYINLNQPDLSGSLGRDRFCAMLEFLTARFPGVGISPWTFPYHHQPELIDTYPDKQMIFYTITQPALIQAIRNIDAARQIIITPLKQGYWTDGGTSRETGGLFHQPYYDDPNILYAYGSHNGSKFGNICRGNCIDWDKDMTHFNQQWAGAAWFLQQHPSAKIICEEWLGLCIHGGAPCNDRPIHQQRLDWLRAMWGRALQLKSSWIYHVYSSPGNWGQYPETPLEKFGEETAVVPLLREYNRRSQVERTIDDIKTFIISITP